MVPLQTLADPNWRRHPPFVARSVPLSRLVTCGAGFGILPRDTCVLRRRSLQTSHDTSPSRTTVTGLTWQGTLSPYATATRMVRLGRQSRSVRLGCTPG